MVDVPEMQQQRLGSLTGITKDKLTELDVVSFVDLLTVKDNEPHEGDSRYYSSNNSFVLGSR